MSTLDVQRVTGVIELDVPVLTSINAAFNTANSALPNTSGATFAGNLTITGNVTVSSNTISVGGNNISPVQSFRNKVINGNFDYWQRGTSNTSIGNAQYLADRWVTYRTGSTANVSRQAFTLGQTDVPNEPTYFHRTIVSSVAGSGNRCDIDHYVESVKTLAGQTATLSFWAKADSNKNIAVEFQQYFGTGGSPSTKIDGIGVTTCALTTSWQKFTTTVNLPSISGKTLGTDNNDLLGIYFWFDAGSNFNSRTNSLGQQSGTFDIAQVQLEAGSVATPFEMRPLGVELALCQRYYEKSYDVTTPPGSITTPFNGSVWLAADTVSIGTTLLFRVIKRASPTIIVYNPTTGVSGKVRDSTNAADVTATATDISTSGFGRCTGTFVSARMYSCSWTASAEL